MWKIVVGRTAIRRGVNRFPLESIKTQICVHVLAAVPETENGFVSDKTLMLLQQPSHNNSPQAVSRVRIERAFNPVGPLRQ